MTYMRNMTYMTKKKTWGNFAGNFVFFQILLSSMLFSLSNFVRYIEGQGCGCIHYKILHLHSPWSQQKIKWPENDDTSIWPMSERRTVVRAAMFGSHYHPYAHIYCGINHFNRLNEIIRHFEHTNKLSWFIWKGTASCGIHFWRKHGRVQAFTILSILSLFLSESKRYVSPWSHILSYQVICY